MALDRENYFFTKLLYMKAMFDFIGPDIYVWFVGTSKAKVVQKGIARAIELVRKHTIKCGERCIIILPIKNDTHSYYLEIQRSKCLYKIDIFAGQLPETDATIKRILLNPVRRVCFIGDILISSHGNAVSDFAFL